MSSSAKIEYPISGILSRRRSIRAFSERPIEAEKIHSLFEATRWAPSSTNEQPWVYIYATRDQDELWSKLFESLNEGNKVWARDAPLLIFSMARKKFSYYNMANPYARYDLGGANALLAVQAVELGLQARQMAGYNHERAVLNLNIPEAYELGVFIAVGYPGELSRLPEVLQRREEVPRERRIQDEFVQNRTF